MVQNTDRKVFMNSERETVMERQMEDYGYNMGGYNGDEISDSEWDEADRRDLESEDDPLDEEVTCACSWQGTRGQLLSATGFKFDVEFIYCPICGSDDVGEL